ncbi:MAG: hypothetical protein P8Y34_09190 [Anaerolineales bacterium]
MTPHKPFKQIILAILALTLASLACGRNISEQINPGFSSTEDCQKIKTGITFKKDASSVADYENTRNILSKEGEVEKVINTSGRLTCVWEDPYQSAEKVGTIRAALEIVVIRDSDQAQALYSYLSQQLVDLPKYCQEDNDCTVAVQSFGSERTYYVEKYVFGAREGNPLPSTHTAQLIRLLSGSGESYLLELTVSHPELEPGSEFVTDVVTEIEMSLIPEGLRNPGN